MGFLDLIGVSGTMGTLLFMGLILVLMGIKIVKQYERGVVFTLGKYSYDLDPGLKIIIPFLQVASIVDIREKAVDVPAQEVITRDNISCSISAVIYYNIDKVNVQKSVINVKNLDYAMIQFAQTSMRNIIGQFELDELLSKRLEASTQIKEVVDKKTETRWVNVMSVEIKDINIPDDLKRTIGKQAEAEREKRAKIISSEWELISAQNIKQAAQTLSEAPWALHLRTLQSINDISSDQSNTTVWMVPIEILRAVETITESLKHKTEK
jgi:regulator of protease activity HflC (stomatin/prohibitin superfamily)